MTMNAGRLEEGGTENGIMNYRGKLIGKKDKKRLSEKNGRLKTAMEEVMRKQRLRGYGHVMRGQRIQ